MISQERVKALSHMPEIHCRKRHGTRLFTQRGEPAIPPGQSVSLPVPGIPQQNQKKEVLS